MKLKSLSPGMKILTEAMAQPQGIKKKKVFPGLKKKPMLIKNKQS